MTSSFTQRFIACVLLMAYAMTGTSILPGVVAVMAALDGSHQMHVIGAEKGIGLLLEHRAGQYTPEVRDHRNLLGQVATSLCRSQQGGTHQFDSSRLSDSGRIEREHARDDLSAPKMQILTSTWFGPAFSFSRSTGDMIRLVKPSSSNLSRPMWSLPVPMPMLM
ncbi:MAG: hypothetical protein IPK32_06370 [Verrucomicrobiaceae bacterium]|nr:hypothetical protein [Verrucomicrobiaceae bacterium]